MSPIDRQRSRTTVRARIRAFAAAAAVGVVASGSLVGCAFFAPRPDPSRFYVLTSTAEPSTSHARGSFGVGPLTMPDYLKRSTIVTRTLPNEITPSPIDRWGEPIDRAVPRILQENLRRLLDTDSVVTFPWYANARPDLQVVVDLLRFERDARGQVTLAARWEIRQTDTGATLRSGETRATRDPAGAGMSASVAAQSETLGELSSDIATALRELAARLPEAGESRPTDRRP